MHAPRLWRNAVHDRELQRPVPEGPFADGHFTRTGEYFSGDGFTVLLELKECLAEISVAGGCAEDPEAGQIGLGPTAAGGGYGEQRHEQILSDKAPAGPNRIEQKLHWSTSTDGQKLRKRICKRDRKSVV